MTGDSGSEAATSSEASPSLLRWNLLDESVEQETTNQQNKDFFIDCTDSFGGII